MFFLFWQYSPKLSQFSVQMKTGNNKHIIFYLFFKKRNKMKRMYTRHLIFNIKISASTNFMLLRSKLTPEIYQKVGSVGRKMTQNRFKKCTFYTFFLETPLSLEKIEKLYMIWFSIVKIEIPTNSMLLWLKITLEICEKVTSLDLKTAFNYQNHIIN